MLFVKHEGGFNGVFLEVEKEGSEERKQENVVEGFVVESFVAEDCEIVSIDDEHGGEKKRKKNCSSAMQFH